MFLASTFLNGVAIPYTAVSTTLARYVTNLVVVNDDPVYRVSLVGSATPIRIGNNFLLACCYHQLKDTELDRVGLLSSDGQVLVTSAGVRHFIHRSESDFFDLVVFDFTAPCLAHPELQERFFRLRGIAPDAPNINTSFVQVSGFPSADQGYELEDRNHLHLVKRKIVCSLAPPPADEALVLLNIDEPLNIDPDGLSGGSAFTVQQVDGRFNAYFAGMTVRAGREQIYILKSGYIRNVMVDFINRN